MKLPIFILVDSALLAAESSDQGDETVWTRLRVSDGGNGGAD